MISSGIDLHDVDEYDTPTRFIRIIARTEEFKTLVTVQMDFEDKLLAYDLSELIGEHEIKEITHQVKIV